MAGDFTAIASPACNNGRQITLRAPFVEQSDQILHCSRRSAVGMVTGTGVNRTGNRLPTPDNECGEVRFGRKEKNGERLTVGKVDYQLSDKHSLFGRYLEARRNTPNDL